MKIGILETGPVASDLKQAYGTYPEMFTRMLQSADPGIETDFFAVFNDELPPRSDDADGWIITGSKYGVYEDHSWIKPLEQHIQNCAENRIPMAGFCFGHQILAQALGGKVVKSDKGWGLGVHKYKVVSKQKWMTPALDEFSVVAIHQDQIVEQPPNTTVVASSDFCKFAGLSYGNADNPYAISVQPHPEFGKEFVRDLIEIRRGNVFPEGISEEAVSSLDHPINNLEWAEWVVSFFKKALSEN